jgi:hypothetical protein
VTLAPRAILVINFTAAYNNDLLALPAGRKVRAELLVTFGNADGGHKTGFNVDSDRRQTRSVASDRHDPDRRLDAPPILMLPCEACPSLSCSTNGRRYPRSSELFGERSMPIPGLGAI